MSGTTSYQRSVGSTPLAAFLSVYPFPFFLITVSPPHFSRFIYPMNAPFPPGRTVLAELFPVLPFSLSPPSFSFVLLADGPRPLQGGTIPPLPVFSVRPFFFPRFSPFPHFFRRRSLSRTFNRSHSLRPLPLSALSVMLPRTILFE